jgi:hypothetical protein
MYASLLYCIVQSQSLLSLNSKIFKGIYQEPGKKLPRCQSETSLLIGLQPLF